MKIPFLITPHSRSAPRRAGNRHFVPVLVVALSLNSWITWKRRRRFKYTATLKHTNFAARTNYVVPKK
jgi:hypothetical protein